LPDRPELSIDAFLSMKRRGVLLDTVQHVEAYNATFTSNMQSLREVVANHRAPYFTTMDSLLEIHGTLFKGIHKEAGTVRNRHVVAGTSMPTDHPRIPIELELRRHQMLEIAGSFDKLSVINAAAFGFVRAKAIQTFIDGNKRSARTQGSFLIFAVHNEFPNWEPKDECYAASAKAAKGDLTDLVNLLRRGLNIPPLTTKYFAPFRIRPFFEGDGIISSSMSFDTLFNLTIEHRESHPKFLRK